MRSGNNFWYVHVIIFSFYRNNSNNLNLSTNLNSSIFRIWVRSKSEKDCFLWLTSFFTLLMQSINHYFNSWSFILFYVNELLFNFLNLFESYIVWDILSRLFSRGLIFLVLALLNYYSFYYNFFSIDMSASSYSCLYASVILFSLSFYLA